MISETSTVVKDHYTEVLPILLSAATDFLVVARREAGDLDTQLVLMVVLLRTVMSPEFAKIPSEKVLTGELDRLPSLNTNIRSIADSTGLPRETVRRKVNELIARGWIARSGQLLGIAPKVFVELRHSHEKLIKFATVSHETISRMAQVS